MTRVAVGFRHHSGWAVAVTVGGTVGAPEVVDRRRVDLLDGTVPKQPYHAAQGADPEAGLALVQRVEDVAATGAAGAIRELVGELRARGLETVAAGIAAEPRDLPPFERVMTSHALLHSAEGELYRAALVRAIEDAGVPVTHVSPKGLLDAGAGIGVDAARLTLLGRMLGPPWQKDHREAVIAALLALRSA